MLAGVANAALIPPDVGQSLSTVPPALFSGDVNGDGRVDVLVPAQYGSIRVYLNGGNGTLTAGSPITSNAFDGGLRDVNGDNKLDLVTLESLGAVELRVGVGDGTFGAPTVVGGAADIDRELLRVGDVTGDGKADVVVGRYASPNTALDVLVGDGAGGFASPVTTTVPGGSSSLTLGRINGDARDDLVVVTTDGRVDVTYGAADGSFGGRQTLFGPVAPLARAATLGDFDADGQRDDIAFTRGDGCSLEVETQANGSFTRQGVPQSVGCHPNAAPVTADFNGDGRDDVWAGARYMGVGRSGLSTYPVGEGSEVFADQRAVPLELNGDGRQDLVVTGSNSSSRPWLSVLVSEARVGYTLLDENGDGYVFGGAQGVAPNAASLYGGATDLAAVPAGGGFSVLDAAGGVWSEPLFSRTLVVPGGSLMGDEVATSLSLTPNGQGGWVFTSLGRVFPFGNAPALGDMSGIALNGPVLDSVATPSGLGYYMVASDGGVFAFGDAVFRGSMGGIQLNEPVQSLVPDPDGYGYWLVAADGGVFAFDAPFVGSIPGVLAPGQALNAAVVGMVAYGNGYLMVGEDGGVFNFSDLPFAGSLGSNPPDAPVVAIAEYRD